MKKKIKFKNTTIIFKAYDKDDCFKSKSITIGTMSEHEWEAHWHIYNTASKYIKSINIHEELLKMKYIDEKPVFIKKPKRL